MKQRARGFTLIEVLAALVVLAIALGIAWLAYFLFHSFALGAFVAGLVLNGKIWRGRHGIAGELGHVTVQPGGPVSGAGLDGALEAVASGTAIARDASYALNRDVSTAEAFQLAEQGHPAARRVVEQAMKHIGVALADLQKVIDPEVFVIGGGVASVGDYFFRGVQHAANEYSQGFAPVSIRRAQLGTDAGVIGAALAARHG